jgi:hypothetical protein
MMHFSTRAFNTSLQVCPPQSPLLLLVSMFAFKLTSCVKSWLNLASFADKRTMAIDATPRTCSDLERHHTFSLSHSFTRFHAIAKPKA